jgi:hypothetical protein
MRNLKILAKHLDKFKEHNVDNTWKLWEELRRVVLQKGMEISHLI